MSKGTIIGLGVVGVVIVMLIMVGSMWASYHNQEVTLRKAINMKQEDNKNEYDGMWKKISQVAQVSEKHKDALKDIFEGYANARGGVGGGLMSWLQEAVPNVDLKTFENLQNIITSSRDRFVMRQKELLDLKREHDSLLERFPSCLFVGGRPAIDVQIVTSTKTEKSFDTGVDDDVNVFGD